MPENNTQDTLEPEEPDSEENIGNEWFYELLSEMRF